MRQLIARVWRALRGSWQWRLLWLGHAKFMIGVTGVVRDDEGRFLVLKHRLWPEGRQWGLPTGCAEKGETWEQTVEREVREETGLEVETGRLIHIKSGYRLRAEAAYEARLIGGSLRIDPMEILEARWCTAAELPAAMHPAHRALVSGSVQN